MSEEKRRRLTDVQLASRIALAAERADARAEATDGPIPPTWECMDERTLRQFFRDAYVLAKRVQIQATQPRRKL